MGLKSHIENSTQWSKLVKEGEMGLISYVENGKGTVSKTYERGRDGINIIH